MTECRESPDDGSLTPWGETADGHWPIPTEPQTFDWQMGGTNDKSWKGKARSWIEDTPGRARALTSNKTLAVWIPSAPGVWWWDRSSLALAVWIAVLTWQASAMPSSASPTPTDETCSPPDGPESPSTKTYEAWDAFNQQETGEVTRSLRRSTGGGLHDALIFSAEGSPARTSPSPENEPDSPVSAPGSSSSSPASLSLFDPDGFSSRTYPVSSLATAVGTSESCLERWPTSGMAWRGGLSTHVSSECRSDDEGCSSSEPSLSRILQTQEEINSALPPSEQDKYSLSARAATGILRRAQKRGRSLPSHLSQALEQVAQTTMTAKEDA